MHGTKEVSLKLQRGVSITGLIVVLGVLAAIAMLGMKVFPPIMEYQSAKDAMIAAKARTDVAPKISFQKSVDLNNITSISSRDLMVYKAQGQTELAFDYEVRVDLFKNVALLLHFAATTDPTGVIPEKAPVIEK